MQSLKDCYHCGRIMVLRVASYASNELVTEEHDEVLGDGCGKTLRILLELDLRVFVAILERWIKVECICNNKYQ